MALTISETTVRIATSSIRAGGTATSVTGLLAKGLSRFSYAHDDVAHDVGVDEVTLVVSLEVAAADGPFPVVQVAFGSCYRSV